jgi:hypothetical protein
MNDAMTQVRHGRNYGFGLKEKLIVSSGSAIPNIYCHTPCHTYKEYNCGYGVYQGRREINSSQFKQEKMNVGIGLVMITQLLPDGPMPVRAKAVAPSIPDAQDKPRTGGEEQCYEIQLPGPGNKPAKHIEEGQRGMKNNEEDI